MTPTERATIAARRESRRGPHATRYEYVRRWPITDDTMTVRELSAEGLPDLRYAIAAAGAHATGPPRWEVTENAAGEPELVATVPCILARGSAVKEIDDQAVAHLMREGVTTTRIAAMMGVPRELIELAALRCSHRSNVEDQLERELSLDEIGLSNEDRMWRTGRAVV